MIGISIELRPPLNQGNPRRPTRKAMILNVLTSGDPGGMTADEIGERLVLDGTIPDNRPSFVRPRLSELRRDGLVEVVDRRPGNTRRKTYVWRIKP